MLAWTWGTWPDLLIDFGRDVYVAWRIVEGEVLYRDLGYFNGPLSPYLNAAWMAWVGEGLRWLVVLNLLVATATAAMLYALLVTISDRWSATVALLVFVLLFSSIQLLPVANYNFLTPYSHEITHGFALSLLALWAIGRHRASGELRWVVLSGAALGLTFLTKVEIFLAAFAGTGLALLFAVGDRTRSARPAGGAVVGCAFAVAALVPVALAWLALSTQLPPGDALRGTLGACTHLFNREAADLDFYRRGMGLLSPRHSIASMLRGLGVYLLVIAVVLGISRLLGRLRLSMPLLAAGGFALGGACVWIGIERSALVAVGRPLPVAVMLIGLAVLIHWWRIPRDHPQRAAAELALCFCVFSFALLAKMILNARIFHYGFVLALPATMLTIVALMSWLPRVVARAPAQQLLWRACLLGAITAVVVAHLQLAADWRAKRTFAIGRGPDRIMVDRRSASLFKRVAEAMQERLPATGTLAVLPQGALLNYLLRRENPTGFVQFIPPEILFFGEERILEAFRAHPPDAIVFITMDSSGYGVGQFGEGYARGLWQWVESNYRPAAKLGDPRRPARLLLRDRPAEEGREPPERESPSGPEGSDRRMGTSSLATYSPSRR